MPFPEPITTGARHALDLLGMYIQQAGAQRIYIVSDDAFWVRQILLRVPLSVTSVRVDVAELTEEGWPFQLDLQDAPAALTLLPFFLDDALKSGQFQTPYVAGCFRSAFSYRRLLQPCLPGVNPFALRAVLTECGYTLREWRGVYPPAFLFWWALSLVAGTRFSSLHWQFSARAETHLESRALAVCHLGTFLARKERA